MRILFVRQSFSSFGGGELILDRLIRQLADEGADVSIIARSWPAGPPGVGFIRCDPPRVTRALRDRLFATAACRLVAAQTGALVQAHERIPCCDIYRAGEGVHAAYLERREKGMSGLARAGLRMSPFHRSALGLERALFKSSRLKAVVVNSQMVADEILRHFSYPRERIHLVPNGIDLARFSPEARGQHRAAMRRQFGVSEDRPVALFVGSGFARKGLAQAIEALSRSHVDAELWAIGRERQPSAYAALAERHGVGPRLRLLGPQADVLAYYAAADMLLLPSIYDPFPSTVIEALACGLPVVTSTGCGARDAVAQLDPALVRDPLDVDGLAAAIELAFVLASSPPTAGAARGIAEGYGMDRMVEGMLALYRGLAPMAGAMR
jgi:UDP-glucose:(heptosyl)LPS alpha-1,3-glucosyltransferase